MADLFTLSERRDLSPSFRRRGGVNTRVLRVGTGRGAPTWDETKYIQLVPPGEDWLKAKVYSLTVDDGWLARHRFQRNGWIVVATSRAAAVSYVERRMTKVADQTAGAAKDVLGYAMAELSTHPLAPRAAHGHAKKVARENFKVTKVGFGANEYEVRIVDSLVYAQDALRGGASAVDVALMKAANKIAGRLTHHLHRHNDFEHDFGTPFPEVKRRR